LKAEFGRAAAATPKTSIEEASQKSDVDDEEMEYEPEKLNRELDVGSGSS
jgi:hypothetical protein